MKKSILLGLFIGAMGNFPGLWITAQNPSPCFEITKQISPLLRTGEYGPALLISDSSARVCASEFGELSAEHAEALENKVLVLYYMRDYTGAHEISRKSGAIFRKIGLTNTKGYSTHLGNLALIYKGEGKTNLALTVIDSAIIISRSIIPFDFESLVSRLNTKATLLMVLEQEQEAIPILEEGIQILSNAADDKLLISMLANIATCYESIGEIKKAEDCLMRSGSLARIVYGEKSIEYITIHSNIATQLHHFGKYERSKIVFLEALQLARKGIGSEHVQTGIIWLNYGQLLYEMGQVDAGIEATDSAGVALRKSVGEKHPYYYSFLNNIGQLYQDKGKFAQSLHYFFKAIDLAREKAGENSPPVLRTMHNIGGLYAGFGYFEKSQEMERVVEREWRTLRGTNNQEYANIVSRIAQNFSAVNQVDSAIIFTGIALETVQNLYDTLHADYATRLFFLGSLYLKKRDFKAALIHVERAANILLKLFGGEHPEYANALSKLAQIYLEMGNSIKAEDFLRQSLQKMILTRGEGHPEIGIIKSEIAELLEITGRKEEASVIFREASLNNREHTEAGINLLTEAGRERFIEHNRAFYNRFWSFASRNPTSDNIIAVFEDAALLKNLLLESQNSLTTLIASQPEPLQQKFLDWQATKQSVFTGMTGVSKSIPGELQKLIKKADMLEEELMAESSIFRLLKQKLSWGTIHQSLNPDEALIEFIHFDNYQNGAKTDSVLYYAIIGRFNDAEPFLTFLFEEKQLLSALRRGGMRTKEQIEDIYRGKTGEALYNLLWRPLEPHLAGVETVHFSPAGLLHSIAFGAIPTASGQYLTDRYSLRQYGSTRELVTGQTLHGDSIQNARVYGGIRYGVNDDISKRCNDYLLALNRGGLDYLPCSPYEMRQVRDVLTEKGIKTDTLSGFEATEETMKPSPSASAGSRRSPDLLHISTHGAYLKQPEKPGSTTARPLFLEMNSPLARSFLAFANADSAFRGQPRPGAEDGLLTAFEISGLDLSGTKLAVLSACETALGDIQGSEGVYGLQRAFKIAGVEHLIVSLWKVEDSGATIDFMTTFYQHFFDGLEVREAFAQTQREMREKYKKPYLWAAFVLL